MYNYFHFFLNRVLEGYKSYKVTMLQSYTCYTPYLEMLNKC